MSGGFGISNSNDYDDDGNVVVDTDNVVEIRGRAEPPVDDMWEGSDAAPVPDGTRGQPGSSVADDPDPFVDVAAILAGDLTPPKATLLRRRDGHCLFYAGKVNVLFGDPESGKSWIAYAAVVQTLADGGRAAVVDVDHNGSADIVNRLLLLGADPRVLSDRDRFRLTEPEDGRELVEVIALINGWVATVVVIDSIGEVVPMLGLSSNSPDDYTTAHRRVLTAASRSGAAVIGIDHLPKDDGARSHGQTGTLAKKRAVGGASLRVSLVEVFAPGRGGAASLTIHKDRPGGVRAHCPVSGKNQPAGRFVMTANPDGSVSWQITEPKLNDLPSLAIDDIAELDALDPAPSSKTDVQKRLGWGGTRANNALREWRESKGENQ